MSAAVFASVYSRRWGAREELGVGYVAAALKRRGHDVEVVLVAADGEDGMAGLREALRRRRPALVGVGCSHSAIDLSAYRRISRTVREAAGGVHLTCGGYAATFNARRFLDHWDDLDSVVVGEGEQTVVEMMDALSGGHAVDGCPGVLTRDNSLVPREPAPRLDDLPNPHRDLTGLPGSNLAPISTSRGCLAHCTFCNVPAWTREHGGWRGRSPDAVVQEMRTLNRQRGVRRFWIVDSSYEDPYPNGFGRILAIADGLIENRLAVSYYVFFRAESVLHPEFQAALPRLIDSGLRRVFIGVEAGTKRQLKGFGKRASLAQTREALRLFERHGVAVRHGFIMFTPHASFESLRENMEFVRQCGFLASTADLTTRLELYTGAAEVTKLRRDGLLTGDPWNDDFAYRFVEPRIEPLARSMSELRALNLPRHNWEALHTARLVSWSATLSPQVARDRALSSKARFFREEVDEVWSIMEESNEEFFLALLRLSQNGWDGREFKRLVKVHVDGVHAEAASACADLTRAFLLEAARRQVDVVY